MTAPVLPIQGVYALAIMAFAVVLWVTEVVPFAVTALIVLLLIPASGIADYKTVVKAGFGDPIVTFFIGVLILSSAFTRSGLGTRLVHLVLARVGTRTDRVLLGLLVVGVLISMWITKMAVAAMLLPVGTGLLAEAGVERGRSNFGRIIMIAVAFGPLIGGIATPAGTGANLVALAQLKQLAQTDISFGRWMLYGVPACVLMVPVAWKLLLWLFPPELATLGISDEEARARARALGPLSRDERWTLAIFGTAIALWILAPFFETWTHGRIALPAEAIGLGAGLSLFLPGVRVLTWKDAQRDIDWGGIVLIASGLSLGAVIYDSGAARWLAWILLGRVTLVPLLLRPLVIVLGVSALRLMFSSNTVAAAIITPILVALAHDLRLDAWSVVAPAAFAATMGFVLVSQGPTTIIPYGAGYFSIKDMAKAGVWMTLAAAVCVAIPGAVLEWLAPAAVVASAAAPAPRCEALSALRLEHAASLVAIDVAAGAFEPDTTLPAFCRVELTLTPSDDSRIGAEVWLPTEGWNGKFQAVGNRGWGGTIMRPAMGAALRAGYATASTDTGHTGGGARFALGHPEKVIDAGYRAVHETTVASRRIVDAYYGREARRSYWNGCSLGGRQGLAEAQRYPSDYDAIVVGDAAYDVPRLYTGRLALATAIRQSGRSLIPPAKFALVHRAVLDVCDARDGVADGVISDPPECRFDPRALECKAADEATCLTAAQVESVRALYAPLRSPRDASIVYPGLEPGSELGWAAVAGAQPENNALDLFRFVVFKDAGWDWNTFTLPEALAAADMPEHSALNASDPDLRPFFSRGGKLLMYHGWADPQTPPKNTLRFADAVTAAVGRRIASTSLRVFMVPGMGHCEGGDGTDTFDKAAALDEWVERGVAPTRIVASRVRDGRVDRTRPLCPYPQVARWNGRADTNDAASFTCAPR